MILDRLTVILAAAAPTGTQANPTGQMIQMVGMTALMLVALYVLMIRPQSKKAKELAAQVASIKPGDKIVTNGGVVGTVLTVKERTISIRSAETKLEVLKSAVSQITERGGESSASES